MLLPDNVHPENSIYYKGSFVLKELQIQKEQDLLVLYQKIKESQGINFSVFILCLDWLYLLDVIELNKEKVKLCS